MQGADNQGKPHNQGEDPGLFRLILGAREGRTVWQHFYACIAPHITLRAKVIGIAAFSSAAFMTFSAFFILRIRHENMSAQELAAAWSELAVLFAGMVVASVILALLLQVVILGPIEALRHYAEHRQSPDPEMLKHSDEVGVIARALDDVFRATSEQEARIATLAQRDSITGLANRSAFKAHIAAEIASSAQGLIGILTVNLDNFKNLNETLGHDFGDVVLQHTADVLRQSQRTGDMVARLGGDEFGIALCGLRDADDAIEIANRCLLAIAAQQKIGAHDIQQTACAGVTFYPQDGRDPESLIKNADLALTRAKHEGPGSCTLYRHELHLRAIERNSIERDLRMALARRQFCLYYQPKIDIGSGRIVGSEALIRWQHPERGLISPAVFIPVAERSGIIAELTKWVLDEACNQNAAWQQFGLPKVSVAVNVSAVDLRRSDLSDIVASTLMRRGLAPQYLELEITESMVMRDVDVVIGTLRRLRSLGVAIGIDDFGTGYSSLAYLRRFPVKRLKIDRTFVRDLVDTRDGHVIPKVIIDLAHSLGISVLAEGVETAEQFEILRGLGCDEAQGYLLGRPMPAADFETVLRRSMQEEGARPCLPADMAQSA